MLHWIASENMETALQIDPTTRSPGNLLLVSKEFTQHKQFQINTRQAWESVSQLSVINIRIYMHLSGNLDGFYDGKIL